mmetsp:Transcript_143254/g.445282  ORF Transcript_143254/g.445282 Transcript_143254/m.445282 type:complete len:371 (-) Transcript_143254:287-1399(-)
MTSCTGPCWSFLSTGLKKTWESFPKGPGSPMRTLDDTVLLTLPELQFAQDCCGLYKTREEHSNAFSDDLSGRHSVDSPAADDCTPTSLHGGSISEGAGRPGEDSNEGTPGVHAEVAPRGRRRSISRTTVWRLLVKGMHRGRRYMVAAKAKLAESRRTGRVRSAGAESLPAMQLPDTSSDSSARSVCSFSSRGSAGSGSSVSSPACGSACSSSSTAASEGEGADSRARLADGIVVKQPEDGSCLFHSIAFGLGDRTSGSMLRKQIVAFIVAHPSLKIANTTIREWIRMTSGKSPEAYTKEMTYRGTWGGALELAVAARIKGVNIDVYERFEGRFRCITTFKESPAGRTVNLLYSTEPCRHYDALLLRKAPR